MSKPKQSAVERIQAAAAKHGAEVEIVHLKPGTGTVMFLAKRARAASE